MIDAVMNSGPEDSGTTTRRKTATSLLDESDMAATGRSVVLIDHEDSFVHTLGDYLSHTGAEVRTLRSVPLALGAMEKMIPEGNKPDMVRANQRAAPRGCDVPCEMSDSRRLPPPPLPPFSGIKS